MKMAEDNELLLFPDDLIDQLHIKARNKVEYWDIRAGLSKGNTIEFSDEKSKEITSYLLTGCSIRTFSEGGWGFRVLKSASKQNLLDEFDNAIKLAKLSSSLCKFKFHIKERDALTQDFKINSKRKLEDVDITEKIELVKGHESIASNYSKLIKNTRTIYLDSHVNLVFLDAYGTKVNQELEILRLFSSVYAQSKGIIQNGTNSIGAVGGFEVMNTEKAISLSKKSSEQAINLLNAKSPLGGSFRVILDSKLTGTFIHEALGHACEADLVLNKESILIGKIGEKIAIEDVSVIDDPRFGQGEKLNLPYELFGCYFIDEEGTPAQKTVIIKDGVLQNFIHSLETASRMNHNPNGHGRANSNSSKPQVRMGFTFLEPKDWNLDEMIEDTKQGILCEDFQYGYTDPTTGNFQFKCRISTKIENGEKKENLRDVSFGGMTLDVLKKISAIGNESTFNYSDGICGKGGQGIRVCDGGPYIRIDDLTVGGLN
jgi:TldD protein